MGETERLEVGPAITIAMFVLGIALVTVVPLAIGQFGPKEHYVEYANDTACDGDKLLGYRSNGIGIGVADCERWAPVTVGVVLFSMILGLFTIIVAVALTIGYADRW